MRDAGSIRMVSHGVYHELDGVGVHIYSPEKTLAERTKTRLNSHSIQLPDVVINFLAIPVFGSMVLT